jgi:hypothetical protein
MTDAKFLEALESCTLPETEFGHAAHVRAGYLYLRSLEFAAALARIRTVVRNYAAALGKAERYHETITVAYLALIHEHMVQRGDGGDWPAFERENRELFEPDALLRFYSPSQLHSDLARRIFLLPRLASARPSPGHQKKVGVGESVFP